MVGLSRPLRLSVSLIYAVSATPYLKDMVWALSISLAATPEIDDSFSSSGYLDVSVPRVYLPEAIYSLQDT